MAVESVPLDGPKTRNARLPWLAPLTVLTGVATMAALGSGVLTRAPVPASEIARARAEAPTPVPASEERAETAAAESETADPSAPGREAAGALQSRWAWNQIAPPSLTPEPAPDSAAEPGIVAGIVANAQPGTQVGEPPAAMMVPLPIPRPPEFRAPAGTGYARRPDRRMARRELPPAAQPAPQPEERSFLEKLFGIERGPALAYAALESRPAAVAPPPQRVSPPLALSRDPGPTAGTAVYNIAAKTVTLPNGERLEAHSGLGEGLDDPRLVNVRMRGPTPPGTYDLTERERPFHGVRAIRLTPVGGNEVVYGRVGLLAHTYMLGPRGDSNGCVSFRDYDRFLQAFLRGEVQRLVVVSGTQDPLPSLAAGTVTTRMARNGG
ncbi:tlde1 domain-containing protein [Methylobacterium sp. C33D]